MEHGLEKTDGNVFKIFIAIEILLYSLIFIENNFTFFSDVIYVTRKNIFGASRDEVRLSFARGNRSSESGKPTIFSDCERLPNLSNY